MIEGTQGYIVHNNITYKDGNVISHGRFENTFQAIRNAQQVAHRQRLKVTRVLVGFKQWENCRMEISNISGYPPPVVDCETKLVCKIDGLTVEQIPIRNLFIVETERY